jgi:hypothetical protein
LAFAAPLLLALSAELSLGCVRLASSAQLADAALDPSASA